MPVLLARAQIEALRTAGDAEARYQAKWLLVRSLYDLGYNAPQVREIFRLVNWMMHLRVDLEELFEQEMMQLEEEKNMPFHTLIERVAVANAYLRLLIQICGPLPDDTEKRVKYLSYEQLEELGIALLQFKSLDDLTKWLDEHGAINGDFSEE